MAAPYTTYAEWNQTGLDQLFVYAAHTVDAFVPMLLFSFYIIIVLASYFASKRLSNDGDIAASVAVAGFATFVLAIVMSAIPGLIPVITIAITFVVFVLGILFLFFSNRR